VLAFGAAEPGKFPCALCGGDQSKTSSYNYHRHLVKDCSAKTDNARKRITGEPSTPVVVSSPIPNDALNLFRLLSPKQQLTLLHNLPGDALAPVREALHAAFASPSSPQQQQPPQQLQPQQQQPQQQQQQQQQHQHQHQHQQRQLQQLQQQRQLLQQQQLEQQFLTLQQLEGDLFAASAVTITDVDASSLAATLKGQPPANFPGDDHPPEGR
jgi:hypothetical protein